MTWTFPEDLIIGYQKRDGTMTGNLGYITYKIGNKHFKEKSLNGWRDNSIDLSELKNKPREGFIISKAETRGNYGFGSGRTLMRIYDPEGFDFEITISNLEYIHRYCDTNKGEFKGKFVYAWYSGNLTLVPVESDLYKEISSVKEEKSMKIRASDLKVGAIYKSKDYNINYVYLGRYDYYREYNRKEIKELNLLSGDTSKYYSSISECSRVQIPKKSHIFYYPGNKTFSTNITSKLSTMVADESDDYDQGLNEFFESNYSKPLKTFGMFDIDENTSDDELLAAKLFMKMGKNNYIPISLEILDSKVGYRLTAFDKLYYVDNDKKLLRGSINELRPVRYYKGTLPYNLKDEDIREKTKNYIEKIPNIKRVFLNDELDIKEELLSNYLFTEYMRYDKEIFDFNFFTFLVNLYTPYDIEKKMVIRKPISLNEAKKYLQLLDVKIFKKEY